MRCEHKTNALIIVIIGTFFGVVMLLNAGSVRDFDAPNARIAMGANLYPDLTNLTLSAWIKTSTAPSSYAAIAGRGYLGVYTGFGLNFKSPDLLAFQTRVNNNSVQADVSYPFDGNWHHVAGVRDGDFTRIYLDGELKDEASGALETLFASNFVFGLGMRNNGGTAWHYPYKGLMAEVRLWNYARSTHEICGDMFRRLTGDESGLIGYWPLDEDTGSGSVSDWAADNDGNIVGAFWGADIFTDTHLPTNVNYRGYWEFTIADSQTGDERLTTTNTLHIIDFPVPNDYDYYQLAFDGELGSIKSTGWKPVDSLSTEFTLNATPGRNLVYAWFTNLNEAVTLRRSVARIIYRPIEAAIDFSPLLSQRVEMKADIYPALSSLTISAWVKTKNLPSIGQRYALAGRGYAQSGCGGFGLELRTDTESVISFHTRYYQTVVAADYQYPDDGHWHHVAGVRDAGSQATRLYLDGELVAETVGALTSLSGHERIFALGARYAPYDNYNFFYDGQLAEVRLWNYARNATEIEADMFESRSGMENGLIGYWSVSEGTGNIVYDYCEGGVDGTMVGNPRWVADDCGVSALLPASRSSSFNSYRSFTLIDSLTGNDRLASLRDFKLAEFPVPDGYDSYQINLSPNSHDVEAEGWLLTNTTPILPDGEIPEAGGRVSYYAWFTNSTQSVKLCRSGGSIVFAPERPALSCGNGNGYVRMRGNCYTDVTNLTLSAWIRSDTLPLNWRGCIAGRGYSSAATGFGLYLENNGTANFQTRQGNDYVLTATASYPFDGHWHHVAGVRDGNFTRLYIDGKLVAQEEGEVPSMSSGHAFCLGARLVNANVNYYYNGAIAEVRLWDYARSVEKIERERYYKLNGDESGLIGYWPCDEGLDLRVFDSAYPSNNGIFVGAVTWEYTVDFMRDRPAPGILMMVR